MDVSEARVIYCLVPTIIQMRQKVQIETKQIKPIYLNTSFDF